MFKAFYKSGWQHPGIAFIGMLPFVIAFALRSRFLLGWLAIFAFEILADALFTGSLDPAAGLGIGKQVGIAFVIAGDFRYFVLVEWVIAQRKNDAERSGLGPWWVWAIAVLLAFVVPILSTIPQLARPAWFPSDEPLVLHRIFLLYEALFLAFALSLRFLVLPRRLRQAEPQRAAWILKITHFEIAQYALWVLADVIILTAEPDVAYLLRAVPNTMYYALFLPFVFWTAPPSLKDGWLRPVGARTG